MSEYHRKRKALNTFIRHIEKAIANAPILIPASSAAHLHERTLEAESILAAATSLGRAIDNAVAAGATTTAVLLTDPEVAEKAVKLVRASGYTCRVAGRHTQACRVTVSI